MTLLHIAAAVFVWLVLGIAVGALVGMFLFYSGEGK